MALVAVLDWFGQPQWAVRLEEKVDGLMATVQEALQGWRDYTDALKSHIAELESSLTAAQGTVQELIDTDAAQDAAQAQALTEQIAQQINDALSAVQNPPTPEPVVDQPVDEGGGTA